VTTTTTTTTTTTMLMMMMMQKEVLVHWESLPSSKCGRRRQDYQKQTQSSTSFLSVSLCVSLSVCPLSRHHPTTDTIGYTQQQPISASSTTSASSSTPSASSSSSSSPPHSTEASFDRHSLGRLETSPQARQQAQPHPSHLRGPSPSLSLSLCLSLYTRKTEDS